MLIKLNLTAEEVKHSWILRARHREETSRLALVPTDLQSVMDKMLSKALWQPTSRLHFIQFLFHTHGIDLVAKVSKGKKEHLTNRKLRAKPIEKLRQCQTLVDKME